MTYFFMNHVEQLSYKPALAPGTDTGCFTHAMRSVASSVRNAFRSLARPLGFMAATGGIPACSDYGFQLAPLPEDVTLPDDSADDDDYSGSLEKGTWFLDTSFVANNIGQRDDALSALQEEDYSRVYNRYSANDLAQNAGEVAAWNTSLAETGRKSYFFMGAPRLVCAITELESIVQAFIDFQLAQSDVTARFAGVHVDIEPHTLDGTDQSCPYVWDNLSRAERQTTLGTNLTYMFSRIRQMLDEKGMKQTPIAVDFQTWYDSIGEEGIWDSEADMREFFGNVGAQVGSVTFKTYCESNPDNIAASVATEEIALQQDGVEVRVALDREEYIEGGSECQIWAEPLDHPNVMGEALNARGYGVDFRHLGVHLDGSLPHD